MTDCNEIEKVAGEMLALVSERPVLITNTLLLDWVERLRSTPTEDRDGRDYCNPCSHPEFRMHVGCHTCPQKEPDKVKPLAQYLAECIEHQVNWSVSAWRQLLQQALDAYESTQGVQIRIERV